MELERNKERGFLRAIAMIALAYLLALSPLISSQIQSARPTAPEQAVSSGWIICTSDGAAAADHDRDGRRPLDHSGHHHCALCAILAALFNPIPVEIYIPGHYRVVAASALSTAVVSLRDSGWSTSWSARAPPFAA